MRRRKWVQTSLAAGAASLACAGESGEERDSLSVFDSNVSLFHWPFRRLPLDETARLVEKMNQLGIESALAGSFEGILQRDLGAVNRRLARECESRAGLSPAGSINPVQPGWREDLKECQEELGMRAIRLHPSYHGYRLGDSCFIELAEAAVEAGMLLQIVAVFEDTRTQPEMLRVQDVDLAPLAEFSIEGKIQILNWRPRGPVLEVLAEKTEVSFDTSRVEGTDGISTLLKQLPASRILFGTHAPFLIPEASLIRIHESDLPDDVVGAILSENMQAFLKA